MCYDWLITNIPSTCLCGEPFTIDHAMICITDGFVIQRPNKLRDLEAELLNMICKDVVTEPVLQDVDGEQLTRGLNKVLDAKLDIHVHGFWEPQRSAFFDVRVCHRMLNPIRTSSHSKYIIIVYTRMRKHVNTQVECLISNMEHSPL